MPTLRKVSPAEAQHWEEEPPRVLRVAQPALAPAEAQRLLGQLADRSGISRIDHRATHGWLARVYPRGKPAINRHFSDGPHGGPAQSLAAAAAWRDAARANLPPKAPRQPRVWRVNLPQHHQVGWLARRVDRAQRYFADGAWGGKDAAEETARVWAAQRAYSGLQNE